MAKLYRPKRNPVPGRIHPLTWQFVQDLLALEPTSQCGGVWADKPGYHNTAGNMLARRPQDYSVRYPRDRKGCMRHSRGVDWTMSGDLVRRYYRRVADVLLGPDDPRLDGWREVIGTRDGKRALRADGITNQEHSADSSHLWHMHFSIRSDSVHLPETYAGMLSLLRGETREQWVQRR